MTDWLTLLLRLAGAGLITLAVAHLPMGHYLNWKEEARRMSAANASIFHVHTFFICAVLVLIGVPAILAPQIFLVRSLAGAWITWSLAAFWMLRAFTQWFIYPTALWRGKRSETIMHVVFSFVWPGLTALFAVCGLVQIGRIG